MSDLIIPRRSFLKVLTGIIAAPAVIKADQLMRVKAIVQPEYLLEAATEKYLYYGFENHVGVVDQSDSQGARFARIVRPALAHLYADIDFTKYNKLFAPQRKGLFS